jgi:hypothetical protein
MVNDASLLALPEPPSCVIYEMYAAEVSVTEIIIN